MGQYRIRGKSRIAGQTGVSGSKNAVLPILAAACLNKGDVEIHNCPRIADTFLSIEILKHIGCRVDFYENTLWIDASGIHETNIPGKWVSQMRSSILFMGAMLGRAGEVSIAFPGGCDIGKRAIDFHLKGLQAMGAAINHEDDILHCKGPLTGADIRLETASVGATENLMLAAVFAKGTTTISNAAMEPEIVDLAQFLQGMGAVVRGAGTNRIAIEGVTKLTGTTHTVISDRIVAGTYLVAAAMTGGDINITGINPQNVVSVSAKLAQMGCKVGYGTDFVTLKGPDRLKSLPYIETAEFPGFPTDMQAQFVAALSIAEGGSVVKERIFDSRDAHAYGLRLMGADIDIRNVTLHEERGITVFDINGVPTLTGATVEAKDLRGGAALVLAGLVADGETVVKNAKYVQRGYEHIEKDLTSLGADVWLEV